MSIRVQVIQAWPQRFESVELELAAGATVETALSASGFDPGPVTGYAVYGERVTLRTTLQDGDRLELLRPLEIDPKQARRRRAGGR